MPGREVGQRGEFAGKFPTPPRPQKPAMPALYCDNIRKLAVNLDSIAISPALQTIEDIPDRGSPNVSADICDILLWLIVRVSAAVHVDIKNSHICHSCCPSRY